MAKTSTYDIEFSTVRIWLLGKEKPTLFTRVIFWMGVPVWVWLFFSFLLQTLSIRMVNVSGNAAEIKENIRAIGEAYGIADFENQYATMGMSGVLASALFVAGLILMWRQWKAGYAFILIGLSACVAIPAYFLGGKFFLEEQSAWHWMLPGLVLLLAMIDWVVKMRITSPR